MQNALHSTIRDAVKNPSKQYILPTKNFLAADYRVHGTKK